MRRGVNYDIFVDRVLDKLVAFYECLDFHDGRGKHPFHLPTHVSSTLMKVVDELLVVEVVPLVNKNFGRCFTAIHPW